MTFFWSVISRNLFLLSFLFWSIHPMKPCPSLFCWFGLFCLCHVPSWLHVLGFCQLDFPVTLRLAWASRTTTRFWRSAARDSATARVGSPSDAVCLEERNWFSTHYFATRHESESVRPPSCFSAQSKVWLRIAPLESCRVVVQLG